MNNQTITNPTNEHMWQRIKKKITIINKQAHEKGKEKQQTKRKNNNSFCATAGLAPTPNHNGSKQKKNQNSCWLINRLQKVNKRLREKKNTKQNDNNNKKLNIKNVNREWLKER